MNRPEPMGVTWEADGIYGDGNSMIFTDMDSIYIFLDADGRVGSGFDLS